MGQHFHFNYHPIQAILRQIFVFIKCSKHLQCFCIQKPRRINFDNQKIFFWIVFFKKQPGFPLKASQNNQLPLFALKAGYRTIPLTAERPKLFLHTALQAIKDKKAEKRAEAKRKGELTDSGDEYVPYSGEFTASCPRPSISNDGCLAISEAIEKIQPKKVQIKNKSRVRRLSEIENGGFSSGASSRSQSRYVLLTVQY